MDGVNKTLYIPLYGKAYVSRNGLFIEDRMAEEIWEAEGFLLEGKSASKWLAYYMGIRAAVFDNWVKEQMRAHADAVVVHIGCGLDSRALRVGHGAHGWYDVDFPKVIRERKRYFRESDSYRMIPGDARASGWLREIPEGGHAIVVMEGVSMYLTDGEMRGLMENLSAHFDGFSVLADCYTVLAAKASRYKNPINDVGVTRVYGIDDPQTFAPKGVSFVKEHEMTPERYMQELKGVRGWIFRRLYAGGFSRKLYRLYEYKKG